jgi:hypothetical protein
MIVVVSNVIDESYETYIVPSHIFNMQIHVKGIVSCHYIHFIATNTS